MQQSNMLQSNIDPCLFYVLRCNTFVSCIALQCVCFMYCFAIRLFRVLHCNTFVSCIALQCVCSISGTKSDQVAQTHRIGRKYRRVGDKKFLTPYLRGVVNFQSKGELVGSGNFGNQNTLVANTQRSIGLHLADFLGTKVLAHFWP